jgi:hypothetical protein
VQLGSFSRTEQRSHKMFEAPTSPLSLETIPGRCNYFVQASEAFLPMAQIRNVPRSSIIRTSEQPPLPGARDVPLRSEASSTYARRIFPQACEAVPLSRTDRVRTWAIDWGFCFAWRLWRLL